MPAESPNGEQSAQLKNAEDHIEKIFRRLGIYAWDRDAAVNFVLIQYQLYFARLPSNPLHSYAMGCTHPLDALSFGKRALLHLVSQLFLNCPDYRSRGPIDLEAGVTTGSEALRFSARYQLFYDLFFGANRE